MKKYFIFLIFFFALTVQANTDISDHLTLTSDTTWSPANGVYILHGSVTVPTDITLTIEPGAVVKFQGGGAGGGGAMFSGLGHARRERCARHHHGNDHRSGIPRIRSP